jgi:hypothetical protein
VNDFSSGGTLMQALLSAALEFELFDCVGEIAFCTIYSGFLHRSVEQFARWADKGTPFNVLQIARLFPDKSE